MENTKETKTMNYTESKNSLSEMSYKDLKDEVINIVSENIIDCRDWSAPDLRNYFCSSLFSFNEEVKRDLAARGNSRDFWLAIAKWVNVLIDNENSKVDVDEEEVDVDEEEVDVVVDDDRSLEEKYYTLNNKYLFMKDNLSSEVKNKALDILESIENASRALKEGRVSCDIQERWEKEIDDCLVVMESMYESKIDVSTKGTKEVFLEYVETLPEEDTRYGRSFRRLFKPHKYF